MQGLCSICYPQHLASNSNGLVITLYDAVAKFDAAHDGTGGILKRINGAT